MSRANPNTTNSWAGVAAWNFSLRAEIGSYDGCENYANEHRGEAISGMLWQEYEIGPHMTLVWNGEKSYWAIRLYDTEIIRYFPDGSFSVDNGGHATPTTRERLQAVVPEGFRVYHHQRQLGLIYTPDHRMGDHPQAARSNGNAVLWPLDHSRIILPTTITVVSA